jgi:hypothetical protein
MSGEPQPARDWDDLDRVLHGLKGIWFGMFSGGFVITLALAAIVMSGGGVQADFSYLKYLFLLPVPFGLLGAYVLVPWLTDPNPPEATDTRDAKTIDDTMYWYPAYMSRFLLKMGFLEGNAILSAIGFFITADWVLIAGPAILLAALLASVPTRASVESFAETARQKMRSRE